MSVFDAVLGAVTSDPFESAAVAFGITNVYLVSRENIWCWPAGIVNVTVYIYVFSHAKLYADSALQIVYLGLSIYGWIAWSRRARKGTSEPALRVTRAPGRELRILGVLGGLATLVLGFLFRRYSDATYPFADSALAAYSLVAQWLMTKKRLENWALWCVLDVFYIAMYESKKLHLTSFLYVVFLLLAMNGFREWWGILKKSAAVGVEHAAAEEATT